MKMRDPHIVPLSRQRIEVLEMLRTLTGASERLFPGDRSASEIPCPDLAPDNLCRLYSLSRVAGVDD